MGTLGRSLVLVALGVATARADVVTSLPGAQLIVTGDASPNAIAITPAAGGIAVTGFDGTLVDGTSESITFSAVQRLSVKMMQANDRLTITQVSLSSIDIGTGRGNDSVE